MYIALREEIRDTSKEIFYYISISKPQAEVIKPYLDDFRIKGVGFFLAIKSNSNLNNNVYLDMCKQNMKKAGMAIIVLDDDTLTSPNLYNYTMFEAGFILSQNKTLFVVNNNISPAVMNDIYVNSPINSVQLATFKDVFHTVNKYLTLPKNLFNDVEIDKYANERIFYIRLLTMMDIKYKSVQAIYNRLKAINEDIEMEDVLSILEESISTGLTVLHFGGIELKQREELWPYRQEMKDLLLDFPVRSIVNKIKIFKTNIEVVNDPTDVVATVKMEFVVPNNEILGVSFKPFFQIEESLITPNDIINVLLADNVKKETIHVSFNSEKCRIYYPLNVNENKLEKEISETLEKDFGMKCNYVYPK